MYVEKTIFEEKEPRSSRSLLEYYDQLLDNFNFPVCAHLSNFNIMLETHFGNRIGFHRRIHLSKSHIIYDKQKAGSYIEAAIKQWGTPDADIFKIAGERFRSSLSSNEPFA